MSASTRVGMSTAQIHVRVINSKQNFLHIQSALPTVSWVPQSWDWRCPMLRLPKHNTKVNLPVCKIPLLSQQVTKLKLPLVPNLERFSELIDRISKVSHQSYTIVPSVERCKGVYNRSNCLGNHCFFPSTPLSPSVRNVVWRAKAHHRLRTTQCLRPSRSETYLASAVAKYHNIRAKEKNKSFGNGWAFLTADGAVIYLECFAAHFQSRELLEARSHLHHSLILEPSTISIGISISIGNSPGSQAQTPAKREEEIHHNALLRGIRHRRGLHHVGSHLPRHGSLLPPPPTTRSPSALANPPKQQLPVNTCFNLAVYCRLRLLAHHRPLEPLRPISRHRQRDDMLRFIHVRRKTQGWMLRVQLHLVRTLHQRRGVRDGEDPKGGVKTDRQRSERAAGHAADDGDEAVFRYLYRPGEAGRRKY